MPDEPTNPNPTGGTSPPNHDLDQLRAENARLKAEMQQIRDGNGAWVPRDRLNQEGEKLRQALAESQKLQQAQDALARQLIGAEEQLRKASDGGKRVQELEAELAKVRAEHSAADVLREAGLKNSVLRNIVLSAYQRDGQGKDFGEWYAAWKEGADADTKELLAAATAQASEGGAAGAGQGAEQGAGAEAASQAEEPPRRRTPAGGSPRQPAAPKGALSPQDVAKMTREQYAEARKNSPGGLVGL